MIGFLSAVFVASLLGSLHCIGMCGGVVAICANAAGESNRIAPQAMYNFGRLISYTIIGVVAGLTGQALNMSADSVLGLQHAAAWLAGGAMILLGVSTICNITGFVARCLPIPKWMQVAFERAYRAALGTSGLRRTLLIGLLTALLPCGWLYAFVLMAAGTGGAISGSATMAVFWAGTVPAMFAMGVGLHVVSARMRRFVPKLTAAALICVGALTISGRLTTPAFAADDVLPASERGGHGADAEMIYSLDPENMPCCSDDDAGTQPDQ